MTPAVVERPNLSLFGIKLELIELIEFREEMLNLLQDTRVDQTLAEPERAKSITEAEESIKVTEERIREFVTAEISNAGIGAYFQEFEKREQIAKDEAARQRLKAIQWEDRRERLKALVMMLMLQTGQKRIEGAGYTLSLRKIAPGADVVQPNLVPAELQRIKVQMNNALWGEIQAAAVMGRPIRREVAARILSEAKVYEPEPNKIDILGVLKSEIECSRCAGTGRIQDGLNCGICLGSGKVPGAVPGCRLVTDKQTLVIK